LDHHFQTFLALQRDLYLPCLLPKMLQSRIGGTDTDAGSSFFLDVPRVQVNGMIVHAAKLRMLALRQLGAALFHVEHVRRWYRVLWNATE
jgi:hypothetical protein